MDSWVKLTESTISNLEYCSDIALLIDSAWAIQHAMSRLAIRYVIRTFRGISSRLTALALTVCGDQLKVVKRLEYRRKLVAANSGAEERQLPQACNIFVTAMMSGFSTREWGTVPLHGVPHGCQIWPSRCRCLVAVCFRSSTSSKHCPSPLGTSGDQ